MPDSLFKSEIIGSFRKTCRLASWLTFGMLILYFFSGVYSVNPSQAGVLLRFGKVLDASISPGIHFALPWPVDTIIRVPIRQMMRISIDEFYENSEPAEAFRSVTGLSSYLITGDNNIVNINCAIQYSIGNPTDFLFSCTNNERLLRSLASNVLIENIAKLPIDETLTSGKSKLQSIIKTELQQKLDDMSAGLQISFVELQDVRSPSQVQSYFNDVINAMLDKEKSINDAQSYRNEKLPSAKASADRLIQDSEAYCQRIVTRADGDAQRFLSLYQEYHRSKTILKNRLRMEILGEILPKLKRAIIVDSSNGQDLIRIIASQTQGTRAGRESIKQ